MQSIILVSFEKHEFHEINMLEYYNLSPVIQNLTHLTFELKLNQSGILQES